MKASRIALVLAVALIGAGPPASLDPAVENAMTSHHVPGAQLVVLDGDHVVLDESFGVTNLQTRELVTPQTQFEIGSVTKQFTAAAILQLRERGKLRLSDPLGKYVPEYAPGKDVTIEQLLWQVTGIPDFTNDVPGSEKLLSTATGGLSQALALIKDRPLYFAPGTQWRYSNTNYLLLGAIVERVSGIPFEAYVRTHIFQPAGMSHSGFILDEKHLPAMATGYQLNDAHELVRAPLLDNGWAAGAGGIVSTAADVAKWDAAFFSGAIVGPADVRLATTPCRLPNGNSTHYGFGWEIDSFDGEPEFSHNGGTLGFSSLNEYFPRLHEAVVALVNSADAAPSYIDSVAFETLHPEIVAAVSAPASGEDPKISGLAREWVRRAQTGQIDTAQLTAQMAKALTPGVVATAKEQLAPLGDPLAVIYRGKESANGVTAYAYRVRFASGTVMFVIGLDAQGKIAEMWFRPA